MRNVSVNLLINAVVHFSDSSFEVFLSFDLVEQVFGALDGALPPHVEFELVSVVSYFNWRLNTRSVHFGIVYHCCWKFELGLIIRMNMSIGTEEDVRAPGRVLDVAAWIPPWWLGSECWSDFFNSRFQSWENVLWTCKFITHWTATIALKPQVLPTIAIRLPQWLRPLPVYVDGLSLGQDTCLQLSWNIWIVHIWRFVVILV